MSDVVALFSHLRRGGGWAFTQSIAPTAGIGPSDWQAPGAPVTIPQHLNGRANLYWGVNPASSPVLPVDRANEKNAGKSDAQIMRWTASKNSSICAVNTFIADLDGKDYTQPTEGELADAYNHVKADMQKRLASGELSRPTPEAGLLNQAFNRAQDVKYKANPAHYKALALAFIQSMALRPSVLVDSGGGYQCYWLLTEPFLIGEGDSAHVRSYIADLYRKWNAYTGGDPACKDLRRIFRIPGTKNVKPKYAPNYPTADFVWCDASLTYSLAEIAEHIHTTPAEPEQRIVQERTAAATARPCEKNYTQSAHLSAYAVRVATAYNAANRITDELLTVGYTDAGDNRMSRPGDGNSKGIQLSPEKNASYHHSSNDPLFGAHLRRPFDVRAIYDFAGDYDAAAAALGPALGILSPEVTQMTIAHCRAIAEFADWSQIIPTDRQSEQGYMTGQTDRRLFDNLLDIMERACRVEGVTISYRQLVGATNTEGQRVAIASVQTAKNFLGRVNGTLLAYTPSDRGTIISLLPENCNVIYSTVCSTLDTSKHNPRFIEVSKVLQTEQINTITFRTHKADDAFATGTARWAREVIDSEKQILMRDNPHYAEAAIAYKKALLSKPETVTDLRAIMGSELLDAYRELMARAAADFLPGLGTFGLLTITDLLTNPGSCAKDIAERRGMKVSSVRGALQKLERWELVETEQPFGLSKIYTLVADVFGEIADRMPEAKTYTIGLQRLDTRLQSDQVWAARTAQEAESDEAKHLAEKRLHRLTEQRMRTVPALHPELSDDEVRQFVYTPIFVPTRQPKAPAMPEPGALAWYRLTELTGKQLLTADEYGELQQLDKVLGAGVSGRHGTVAFDRPGRW